MVNDFNEKNGIKKRLLDFFPVVLEGIREILESMQYFPEETEKLLYVSWLSCFYNATANLHLVHKEKYVRRKE